jgi:hypothetical protein
MAKTPSSKKKATGKKAKATKTPTVGKANDSDVIHIGVTKIKSSASAAVKPKHFHRPQQTETEQPKLKYDKRPKSDADLEREKKNGTLWGYGLKAPGRPKKDDSMETIEAEDAAPQPEPAADGSRRINQKSAPRGNYKTYEGKDGDAMDAAVNAYILAGADKPFAAATAAAAKIDPTFELKRTTLLSRGSKEKVFCYFCWINIISQLHTHLYAY